VTGLSDGAANIQRNPIELPEEPKTIANATVARLMHHAHVVLTAGDSIRLTQATRGRGVKPLAD
jgi:hypothetical protein